MCTGETRRLVRYTVRSISGYAAFLGYTDRQTKHIGYREAAMATAVEQSRTGPDRAIKVAKDTVPYKLASAIQQALLRHDTCDLMAMGPDATSRAVLGIALAGGHLAAHAFGTSSRIYLTSTPTSNGDRALHGVLFRVTKTGITS